MCFYFFVVVRVHKKNQSVQFLKTYPEYNPVRRFVDVCDRKKDVFLYRTEGLSTCDVMDQKERAQKVTHLVIKTNDVIDKKKEDLYSYKKICTRGFIF